MSVEAAGARVTFGASKHRTLLAALALQRGDIVSIDALAEIVWDGMLPTSWRATLRNYVRRVRAVLVQDAPLLHTQHPGYSLQISRWDLDVFAFEDLITAGHTAARKHDWETSSRVFSEALKLWRGTPLIDIGSAQLHQKNVSYLEGIRLGALAKRIEADLRISSDRAPDRIPELRRLTGDYPADERLHGLHMIALSMAGRTAEALAVYQDAYRYAKEELGAEPGAGLRRIQQRILDDEPDLWT